MKYYLVGKPISNEVASNHVANNLEFTAQTARGLLEVDPLTAPQDSTVTLFKSYDAARSAALRDKETTTRSIFTVESQAQINSDDENSPTIDALCSQVEVINISFVHTNLQAGIIYLKEDADPFLNLMKQMRENAQRNSLENPGENHEQALEAGLANEPNAPIAPFTSFEPITPEAPSFKMKALGLLIGAAKKINTGIALTTGFGFWLFGGASKAASLLPAIGSEVPYAGPLAQLGLSLLVTTGAYLTLKIPAVKRLEKELIIKAATKAALFALNRGKKAESVNLFHSPEEEQEAKMREVFAEVSGPLVEMGVRFGVNVMLDEPNLLPQFEGLPQLEVLPNDGLPELEPLPNDDLPELEALPQPALLPQLRALQPNIPAPDAPAPKHGYDLRPRKNIKYH